MADAAGKTDSHHGKTIAPLQYVHDKQAAKHSGCAVKQAVHIAKGKTYQKDSCRGD